MSDERKAQLSVAVDGSGAKQGFADIKAGAADMAQAVSKAGQDASKGVDGIGAATEKLTAQQSRLLEQVKRNATIATEGRAAYQEQKAAILGVSEAAAPYIAQLRAIEQAQRAASSESSFVNGIKAQIIALRESAIQQAGGADALLRYKAAQAGVSAEASHLITQLTNMRAAQAAANAEAERATSRSSFVDGLRAQADAIGKTRTQLLELRAAQLGLTQEAAPYIAKLKIAEQGQAQLGLSAKALNYQLRQVPAQFTDIVTSLQGGQRPLQVLIQQGGQLKDIFGGIGPAARALGGYVLGLVNPFTIAAAAIVGVALAYEKGAKEQREFQNSLTLTGNSLGITINDYGRLRDTLASISTKGKAAEALTEIAKAGVFTKESVQGIAEAAIYMERATGQAIAKTVDQFKELAKDPADAAAKLNEQYNFLTLAIYRQIKALEDQGQKQQAAAVAIRALSDAEAERGKQIIENLGFIETKFRDLAIAAKKGWDAVFNIGRDETGSEQLDRLKKTLADRVARGPLNDTTAAAYEKGNEALRQQIALIERLNGEQAKSAAAQAEKNRLDKLGIDFLKDGDQYKTKAQKRDAEILSAQIVGQQLVNAGKITEAELEQRIANIREKYADKKPAPAVDRDALATQREYERGLASLEHITELARGKAEGLTAAQVKLREVQASPAWEKYTAQQQQQLMLSADIATVLEREAAAIRNVTVAREREMAIYSQAAGALDAGLRASREQADLLDLELSLIGRSRDERDLVIAQRRVELDLARKLAEIDAMALGELDKEALRIAARQKAQIDSANVTTRAVVEKWQQAADEINQSLTNAIEDWVMNGKSLAKGLANAFKQEFANLVLRPTIQAALNSTGLPQMFGQQAGSITGAANGLSGIGSLFGAGGASQATQFTLQNGLISGFGQNMSNIGALLETGSFGSAFGAAIPYIGWAVAIASLISSATKGETRGGGQYGFSFDGLSALNPRRGSTVGASGMGATFLEGPSGGDPQSDAARAAINSTVATINSILTGVSSDIRLTQFQGGYESSDKGRGGVFTGGTFSTGASFGESGKGDNYAGTLYEKTSSNNGDIQTIFSNFVTDNKQAVIEAVQALAGQIPKTLTDIVGTVNAEGLSDADAQALVDKLLGVVQAVQQVGAVLAALPDDFANLKSAGFDVKAALIDAAGGAQNLTSELGSFYDNFYTDAEKQANLQQHLADAFAAVNQAIPATREEYRALLEAQDLTTESGRTLYAALLANADAFAQLHPVVQDATDGIGDAVETLDQALQRLRNPVRTVQDIAQGIVNLEQQTANLRVGLLQAQGDTGGASALQRQIDTAGMTDAEIAIYDYNQSIKDQIAALDAASQAQQDALAQAQQVAQQRESLETQLLQAQGDTAALRERELAALDPANRALQEQIYALEDQKTATEQAAQAAQDAAAAQKAIADERYGLETRLLQLQGDTTALRERELAALDPSNRALQEQIYALEDQQAAAQRASQAAQKARDAADQLRQSWQQVADAILSEAQRIRATMVAQSESALLAQFAILTAQARALNKTAADQLPGAAEALLANAQNTATSRAGLQLLRGQVAQSLEITAGQIRPSSDVVTEIRGLRSDIQKVNERQAKHEAALERLTQRSTTVLEEWAGSDFAVNQ